VGGKKEEGQQAQKKRPKCRSFGCSNMGKKKGRKRKGRTRIALHLVHASTTGGGGGENKLRRDRSPFRLSKEKKERGPFAVLLIIMRGPSKGGGGEVIT